MPATRALTPSFTQDARRPYGAGAVRLWFLTLQEASGSGSASVDFDPGEAEALTIGNLGALPIRIVCEDGGFAATADGAPIHYKLTEDGATNLYYALPFTVEVLTDEDGPPRGRLVFPNIDPALGNVARALKRSPRVTIKLLLLSDFTVSPLDADNARVSIGAPTPVATLDWLKITRARGSVASVEAELGSFDLTREPYPYLRTTPGQTPGLYWGT